MVLDNIKQWLIDNKKGLIIGFIFGAFAAPFLAVFGLVNQYFEVLSLLLTGPMTIIGSLIPNIQTAPNAYNVPAYKWILALGFNGIFYAFIGGIIQSIMRSRKTK